MRNAINTKEGAVEAVRKTLPPDFDVLEDHTIEKEYGWVVFSQTKECIATGDFRHMEVGSGGVLVEKRTGRLIEFGSAYSTENNLQIYEAGYLAHDNFDMLVTAVSDLREAEDLLYRLSILYVRPEFDSETTWRIPKEYKVKEIRARLQQLPCRFNIGSLYFKWQHIERMKASRILRFELLPNEGLRNEPPPLGMGKRA